MTADKISRVAAIGTGTIGASWAAVFLARGLTVAASDPAPVQKPLCMNLSARLGPASRDCRHYLPNRLGRRSASTPSLKRPSRRRSSSRKVLPSARS